MPLPSTVEPVLGPTPPAASPPGLRWPRTLLSSSLRRRGQTFSVGAGWPAPVDRAVGHVGQRQCGARRSLPLVSGHVLHDLLLVDAHLGEVF